MKINKKEIARDLMALGSIPFLVLVLVRVLMVENYLEVFYIVVAIALVGVVSLKIKNINYYAAIIVILAIFTSIFYNDNLYTIFAFLIVVIGLYMMKTYLKKKGVYKSAVLAIICSILSYLISIPLNIPNI